MCACLRACIHACFSACVLLLFACVHAVCCLPFFVRFFVLVADLFTFFASLVGSSTICQLLSVSVCGGEGEISELWSVSVCCCICVSVSSHPSGVRVNLPVPASVHVYVFAFHSKFSRLFAIQGPGRQDKHGEARRQHSCQSQRS